MYKSVFLIISFLLCNFAFADINVKEINLTHHHQLQLNADGPIITKVNVQRNRIAVLHTNSSMISVIDGATHKVTNIPIAGRGIQHFKDESFFIDSKSGNIYAVGDHCLHVVFPDQKTSKTIATNKQFDMCAVDSDNDNAFLIGRESKELAKINIQSETVEYIGWAEKAEPLINLNQTPPPPIRKIVFDAALKKVFVFDGFTSSLISFDAASGKILNKRTIDMQTAARFHFGGYNEKTHSLYIVSETVKRKVIQAAKIGLESQKDVIVDLPGFTEGVGIIYNEKPDEIYIPYDNHPSVHAVSFADQSKINEIKIPHYGNDASAIDYEKDILYIASWAFGEIEKIDLKSKQYVGRIKNLGIIPHMFNMSFNPNNGNLYFPLGASAVNGTFGSAVTVVNTKSEKTEKIYCGWSPVEIIQIPGKNEFLVFNSEDEFAHVFSDGSFTMHKLPYLFPHQAVHTANNNIYLSYGPHQSYWPSVYIWGAKNGILHINSRTLQMSDRRIPRLAQQMAVDKNGFLYCLQNSWGKEKQFLTVLEDEIREFTPQRRLVLEEEIQRETIQRILKYDLKENLLYLVKVGEHDNHPGKLQIIDLESQKLLKSISVGFNPVDLVFDDSFIYVSNFDSNNIMKISKKNYDVIEFYVGKNPLKLTQLNDEIFCINHSDNSLQRLGANPKTFPLDSPGQPDQLTISGDRLIINSHSSKILTIQVFDPEKEVFEILHQFEYPFGDTRFGTRNNSFYLSGQFGDTIFDLSKIKTDLKGRMWIIDFLSGRLFIIDSE